MLKNDLIMTEISPEKPFYTAVIDNVPSNEVYLSLKAVCKRYGLGYRSALRGKRSWVRGDKVYVVKIMNLVKSK
jgi:hypothetical protein